jgi:hypothetical protein
MLCYKNKKCVISRLFDLILLILRFMRKNCVFSSLLTFGDGASSLSFRRSQPLYSPRLTRGAFLRLSSAPRSKGKGAKKQNFFSKTLK